MERFLEAVVGALVKTTNAAIETARKMGLDEEKIDPTGGA